MPAHAKSLLQQSLTHLACYTPGSLKPTPFDLGTNHSNQNRHWLLDHLTKSRHIYPIMLNITPSQLRKAADIQEKVLELQKELGQLLGGEVPTPVQATEAPRKTWKVSAAGRARMRAAQLARWAAIKGTAPSEEATPKKKRKMSAQALANIRAGVAKRWAAQGKAISAKPTRKRTMSPAAKKKMAALMKARWANARKAGKATL
jgi:hypothetical protein